MTLAAPVSAALPRLGSVRESWGTGRQNGSRRTPNRKSRPSLRQFLATALNCSRDHLIMILEPMLNGCLRRTHAPEGDVSSIVAGRRHELPVASSQTTSASAHITVLGSVPGLFMPCSSARLGWSLVTCGEQMLGRSPKQSEQMCYIAALTPHANRRMMPVAGRSGDMNF